MKALQTLFFVSFFFFLVIAFWWSGKEPRTDPRREQVRHLQRAWSSLYRGNTNALTQKETVTWQDWEGETLLHYVARNGITGLVRQVLDAGGNPNARNRSGETPLIIASYYGHDDVVELLLHSGADPFIRDGHGDDALRAAGMTGSISKPTTPDNLPQHEIAMPRHDIMLYSTTVKRSESNYVHVVQLLLRAGLGENSGRNSRTNIALLVDTQCTNLARTLQEWQKDKP